MLVCFWLGTTLHEQETAQSGQFAQTSNLLVPGPGKSKMVQTSNLLFPGPGKSKMVQTSNLLMVQTGSDFQFAFSRPGKKQNGSDFQFAFFQAGKKQNGSDFHFAFFPGREKAKFQTSNGSDFQFGHQEIRPGSSACGTRAHELLLMSLAPYPLGHCSLKIFPGFRKENWNRTLESPTVLYAHLQL